MHSSCLFSLVLKQKFFNAFKKFCLIENLNIQFVPECTFVVFFIILEAFYETKSQYSIIFSTFIKDINGKYKGNKH